MHTFVFTSSENKLKLIESASLTPLHHPNIECGRLYLPKMTATCPILHGRLQCELDIRPSQDEAISLPPEI